MTSAVFDAPAAVTLPPPLRFPLPLVTATAKASWSTFVMATAMSNPALMFVATFIFFLAYSVEELHLR
jgi:hypothetical protein